jgi:hypothetical protein
MKKLIFVAGILLMMGSCYNDKYDKLYPASPVVSCDTTTITYAHDIQPIIVANCYSPGNGCHDALGSGASGYDYATSIGPLQTNANDGTLLGDINWLPRHNQMPKNGNKLSDCDINKITRWVNLGAKND